MTPTALEPLLATLRRYGVSSYKCGDVAIEFGPAHDEHPQPQEPALDPEIALLMQDPVIRRLASEQVQANVEG